MMWLINKILKWKGVPTEHRLIEELSPEQRRNFVAEAKGLRYSGYMKWFFEDMELLAERHMFKGSKEMLTFGKGILFCIDVMKTNIKTMATGTTRIDSSDKKKMTRFK